MNKPTNVQAIALAGASLAEELFEAASTQGHGRDGTQAIYEVIRNIP